MSKWTAFPYDNSAFVHTLASLKKAWTKLHKGDAEPWPKDEAVQQAWIHFHAGDFKKAFDAGLKVGGSAGINCANKAQAIYANYLEKNEKTKLEMFLAVAERAEALQKTGHVVFEEQVLRVERLDLDVGQLEREPRLAREDQRLARDVEAAQVFSRVRFGVAELFGGGDGARQRHAARDHDGQQRTRDRGRHELLDRSVQHLVGEA